MFFFSFVVCVFLKKNLGNEVLNIDRSHPVVSALCMTTSSRLCKKLAIHVRITIHKETFMGGTRLDSGDRIHLIT